MMATCANCQFFIDPECHRYPPSISQGSRTPAWSTVGADDWCGEWKAQVTPGGLTLTSLTPNTVPAGSTPTTIDVVGTGFDNTCTVYADASPRATFFIDATHLQYTARPDLETVGGTVQISVQGDIGTSNTLPFTFT